MSWLLKQQQCKACSGILSKVSQWLFCLCVLSSLISQSHDKSAAVEREDLNPNIGKILQRITRFLILIIANSALEAAQPWLLAELSFELEASSRFLDLFRNVIHVQGNRDQIADQKRFQKQSFQNQANPGIWSLIQ